MTIERAICELTATTIALGFSRAITGAEGAGHRALGDDVPALLSSSGTSRQSGRDGVVGVASIATAKRSRKESQP
jgi:hypothetical protein